jgi:hypothetical protein
MRTWFEESRWWFVPPPSATPCGRRRAVPGVFRCRGSAASAFDASVAAGRRGGPYALRRFQRQTFGGRARGAFLRARERARPGARPALPPRHARRARRRGVRTPVRDQEPGSRTPTSRQASGGAGFPERSSRGDVPGPTCRPEAPRACGSERAAPVGGSSRRGGYPTPPPSVLRSRVARRAWARGGCLRRRSRSNSDLGAGAVIHGVGRAGCRDPPGSVPFRSSRDGPRRGDPSWRTEARIGLARVATPTRGHMSRPKTR